MPAPAQPLRRLTKAQRELLTRMPLRWEMMTTPDARMATRLVNLGMAIRNDAGVAGHIWYDVTDYGQQALEAGQ